MAIVRQYAPGEANGAGEAVFVFPAPPQGTTWCGTLSIPSAPAGASGMVTLSGGLVGSMFGAGFYGPFTAYANEVLGISVVGLTPNTQYQAVWWTDTTNPPTYPSAITGVTILSGFAGTVPVEVIGLVTVEGTVTSDQGTPNAGGGSAWPVTP